MIPQFGGGEGGGGGDDGGGGECKVIGGVIDEAQPLCCVVPIVEKLKPLPVGAPLPP